MIDVEAERKKFEWSLRKKDQGAYLARWPKNIPSLRDYEIPSTDDQWIGWLAAKRDSESGISASLSRCEALVQRLEKSAT